MEAATCPTAVSGSRVKLVASDKGGGTVGFRRGSSRSSDLPLVDAATPANRLMAAVSQAAKELGNEPVANNLSPAGVLADLRLLLESLSVCWPVWLAHGDATAEPQGPAPAAAAKAAAQGRAAVNLGLLTADLGCSLARSTPLRACFEFRTVLALLVVLLFPKLCALAVAVVVRLEVVRAVMSLVRHLFHSLP